ncbi:30S ribosomal protein S13P [Acidilobus saccharovorans 345-15]|uniref:Small ribosomal subunit protein uS13 n=1 Tax=Acidilobus saccharovorans (strain DSM 16705 / JCM 18335 / VKM B-2471 / 345-15) TaxID=666510 RepID=D9Q278_ACIS3|nr:30S ribosomal protein S13 [Acidilobus saccharovorans]ADL19416.1 30S ribosomal protein S13P [Acidilobus saccharovorans 345-15]
MSKRESTSFTQVVRIANTDIPGEDTVIYGLSRIKGIGYATALAIARKLGIDPTARIGYLQPDVIKRLEDAVNDLTRLSLPSWLYNRRKDYESGQDKHLVGAELIFVARRDIDREIKIGSWRGVRHKLGYKVRGQKTHTTGRTGMTVGVKRAAAVPGAGGEGGKVSSSGGSQEK